MPVRDASHWEPKLWSPRPCHYGEPWMDTYADIVRKVAIRRVWPKGVRRVHDVGCGDGQLGAWVQRTFRCDVWGTDPYEFVSPDGDSAGSRLRGFSRADGQSMDVAVMRFQPQLTMFVTSLPFMTDWGMALAMAGEYRSRYVLVVDNLQTPTPPWQRDLPEKQPIELPELVRVAGLLGYQQQRAVAVNRLDRRLFLRLPRALAFSITLPVDLAISRVTAPARARYSAVLFAHPMEAAEGLLLREGVQMT